MCGIGGIVRLDDQPAQADAAAALPASLQAMLRQLGHRGPDGQGILNQSRCSLVHTRLAILDQPGGRQPMTLGGSAMATPLHVVFNGEIYNHRDLRQQLASLGHRFTTDHSDTEVILHGYRQWGDKLPLKLAGMFALAVWDEKQETLFLARDRMGKKPLWISRQPGALLFGSQPATILTAMRSLGISPAVNPEALRLFLRLGYTFHQALLQGIEELPPAHSATLDRMGHLRTHRYWQPPIVTADAGFAAGDPIIAVKDALAHAVASRLEADVPLGCFLSGGIDSSLIAAVAQRHLRDAGLPPLQTFCAKMPQGDYDESDAARQVANHLGTTHRELVIDPRPGEPLINDLRTLTAMAGEPMADSSLLATYWISQAAREHVKVALAGDGGDELFAGYDRYRAIRWLARHRAWLRWLPAAGLRSTRARGLRARAGRLIDAAQWADPASQYQQMVHLFTLGQMHDLGIADAGSQAIPDWPDEAGISPTIAAMRWDLAHYLPMNLLRKVDRASMAVALEVRCPLLDARLCELACQLPLDALTPRHQPKGLLRRIAREMVPASITKRPKRGFALPMGLWLRGPLRDALADHLQAGHLASLGLSEKAAGRLFDEHQTGQADHTHRLYALLSLSLWAQWLNEASVPLMKT